VIYTEGMPVLVRYPRSGQEKGDRAAWPWLPGVIEDVCGPDEWLVTFECLDVATTEDGSPAPADAADDDLYFPGCFRDSSEIRAVAR